jgi:glycosyltransferase involved in cell wall biosynthesis
MIRNGLTIYMVVYNHFENDSRVLKEAMTLAETGHRVHIFAVWKPGLLRIEKISAPVHDIVIYRMENAPIYLQLLGQRRFDRFKAIIYRSSPRPGNSLSGSFPKGISSEGLLHTREKKGPANWVKFCFSTAKKILLLYAFYRNITHFFLKKGTRADVFHAHDLNTLYICHKMALKFRAKLVYDSHELYVYHNRPYQPPAWFFNMEILFERRYIKKTDAVITVSQSIASYLEKTYAVARPYLIMNTPHQMQKTRKNKLLHQVFNLDEKQKLMVYTGGITFGRGLEMVIESLVESDDLFFVMMGYGEERFKTHLAAVAKKSGVGHRVGFYGPVPYERVTAYTASADIGVAPIENVCLSYYYCAPNKIFEYIQAEVPVVASHFPDLEHIVNSNKIGLVCDMSKPGEITRAVNQVLQNHSTYVNQIRKIKNKYCWENESEKLKKIYQKIIHGDEVNAQSGKRKAH